MTSVKDLITSTEQERDLMPLPLYDNDKIMIGEKTYSTDIIGISTVYNDDTTGNYLGMKIDDGGAFESKMQPNPPEHPNTLYNDGGNYTIHKLYIHICMHTHIIAHIISYIHAYQIHT